jgi:hypothetical protein
MYYIATEKMIISDVILKTNEARQKAGFLI